MRLRDRILIFGIASVLAAPAAFGQQELAQDAIDAEPTASEEIPAGETPGGTSLEQDEIKAEGSSTEDLDALQSDGTNTGSDEENDIAVPDLDGEPTE